MAEACNKTHVTYSGSQAVRVPSYWVPGPQIMLGRCKVILGRMLFKTKILTFHVTFIQHILGHVGALDEDCLNTERAYI